MIGLPFGDRPESKWPVDERQPEHEMLAPAVNSERLDPDRLQAVENVTSESVPNFVEGDVEGAVGGEQASCKPGDLAVGARACPRYPSARSESLESISSSQPDDVANQCGDWWWEPPVDSIATQERDQSIEIPAHHHDANGA